MSTRIGDLTPLFFDRCWMFVLVTLPPCLRRHCVRAGPNGNGNITDLDEHRENLRLNCIPDEIASMGVEDYPAFLAARRALMAQKIDKYFAGL
jgi:hypothetical protein